MSRKDSFVTRFDIGPLTFDSSDFPSPPPEFSLSETSEDRDALHIYNRIDSPPSSRPAPSSQPPASSQKQSLCDVHLSQWRSLEPPETTLRTFKKRKKKLPVAPSSTNFGETPAINLSKDFLKQNGTRATRIKSERGKRALKTALRADKRNESCWRLLVRLEDDEETKRRYALKGAQLVRTSLDLWRSAVVLAKRGYEKVREVVEEALGVEEMQGEFGLWLELVGLEMNAEGKVRVLERCREVCGGEVEWWKHYVFYCQGRKRVRAVEEAVRRFPKEKGFGNALDKIERGEA